MAKFQITGPNGEVYEAEGADDADPSALVAQFMRTPEKQPKAAVPPSAFNRKANPAEYDPSSPEYQAKYGTGPTALERVGRGGMDVAQGLVQRILQLADATPKGIPSMAEIRASASPEEQKLSDAELLARAKEVMERGAAPDYTAQVNEEIAQYEKDRQSQGGGGFDPMRLTGNIAATAPLGLAGAGRTLSARALAGAAQGATAGAAQFTPGGTLGETLVNTAVGGGAGAVLAPAVGYLADRTVPLVQRIAGWWKGRGASGADPTELLTAIPELKKLPPEAQSNLIAEAQDMIRTTGALNTEQLSRKANLIAQGATPTKAMVTRDPGDWTREANTAQMAQSPDPEIAAAAKQLTKVRTDNDTALANKLESFSEGLPKRTQEGHGQSAMQSIGDLADSSQKDVAEVYDAVKAQVGDELAYDARATNRALHGLQDNAYADKLVTSVRNRLRRMGVIDADNHLTGKALTVSQAEEVRKFVYTLPNDYGRRDIINAIDQDVLQGHKVGNVFRTNQLPRSLEPLRPDIERVNELEATYQAQRGQLRESPTPESRNVLEALLRRDRAALEGAREDVLAQVPPRTGGGTHYAEARRAAQERFAMLENPAAQRALNALGELQQGKTAQNFIKSQIIDGADQDVTALVDTIGAMPEAQANRTMDTLRAGVLQHLESEAVNANSGKFSGAKLADSMRKLGDQKLQLILGPDMHEALKDLARAGIDATYEPPYTATNRSGTGATLASLIRRIRGTVGIPLPFVNEVTEKALERKAVEKTVREAIEGRARQALPTVRSAEDIAQQLARLSARVPAAEETQLREPEGKAKGGLLSLPPNKTGMNQKMNFGQGHGHSMLSILGGMGHALSGTPLGHVDRTLRGAHRSLAKFAEGGEVKKAPGLSAKERAQIRGMIERGKDDALDALRSTRAALALSAPTRPANEGDFAYQIDSLRDRLAMKEGGSDAG